MRWKHFEITSRAPPRHVFALLQVRHDGFDERVVRNWPTETRQIFNGAYRPNLQFSLNQTFQFVRRLLRQALFVLKNENWKRDVIVKFTNCLSETILNTQLEKPLGLLMHFSEIYLEELAKVSIERGFVFVWRWCFRYAKGSCPLTCWLSFWVLLSRSWRPAKILE